jgi:hypothetical protein
MMDTVDKARAWDALADTFAKGESKERARCIGVIDTLVESLQEGLMTDAGLTIEDRLAMRHQIEALEVAASGIRLSTPQPNVDEGDGK